MFKLNSLLVIGTSAFIAGAAVSFSGDLSARFVGVADASAGAKAAVTSVDRSRKGDRLMVTVTVRDKAGSAVRSVTNNAPKPKPNPTVDSRDQRKPVGVAPQSNERPPRIPEGCDAAASPIASPQLGRILSKCLV
jgi:hypothetical protein